MVLILKKPDLVDSCKDLSHLGFKEMFSAERTLSSLFKQGKITLGKVKLFRKQYAPFLATILSKMFDKS